MYFPPHLFPSTSFFLKKILASSLVYILLLRSFFCFSMENNLLETLSQGFFYNISLGEKKVCWNVNFPERRRPSITLRKKLQLAHPSHPILSHPIHTHTNEQKTVCCVSCRQLSFSFHIIYKQCFGMLTFFLSTKVHQIRCYRKYQFRQFISMHFSSKTLLSWLENLSWESSGSTVVVFLSPYGLRRGLQVQPEQDALY